MTFCNPSDEEETDDEDYVEEEEESSADEEYDDTSDYDEEVTEFRANARNQRRNPLGTRRGCWNV